MCRIHRIHEGKVFIYAFKFNKARVRLFRLFLVAGLAALLALCLLWGGWLLSAAGPDGLMQAWPRAAGPVFALGGWLLCAAGRDGLAALLAWPSPNFALGGWLLRAAGPDGFTPARKQAYKSCLDLRPPETQAYKSCLDLRPPEKHAYKSCLDLRPPEK